jgi:hypothetical protein
MHCSSNNNNNDDDNNKNNDDNNNNKIIMSKYKTYFMYKITLHAAQTVNTEQLQYSVFPRNTVCFRYMQ